MKTDRPVQYFSAEHLERCSSLTPDQILQFLEEFRLLQESQIIKNEGFIRLPVEPELLDLFWAKAACEGVGWREVIIELMERWVRE